MKSFKTPDLGTPGLSKTSLDIPGRGIPGRGTPGLGTPGLGTPGLCMVPRVWVSRLGCSSQVLSLYGVRPLRPDPPAITDHHATAVKANNSSPTCSLYQLLSTWSAT